ncbi:MAG: ethanolamine utilization protein EutH [Clostridiales bacterium]|nr:ethanolamine utilization protein EutH [Clostridiales bacterium]
MTAENVLMWVLALGAVLGGLDHLLGDRTGLGKRFEEGFQLLGPTALSMAGILCLAPLLSALVQRVVLPLWPWQAVDPSILAGVLAIDMGGYQLAVSTARDPAVGLFSGIVVASTLGCTLSFTVPTGMQLLEGEDRAAFSQGILIGLCTLPAGLLAGGVAEGLGVCRTLLQCLPVFALSLLLILGMTVFPRGALRGFLGFARLIRAASILGLILGSVQYMTGVTLLPDLMPLEEAMSVVSGIGIVLLGSLPAAELLQRALRRPLNWFGQKSGMNRQSLAGLLIGFVSVVPVLAMMPQMDRRGKIVNGACLVGAASALAAHLSFVFSAEAGMMLPLLCAKVVGGVLGAAAAMVAVGPDASALEKEGGRE